MDTHEGGCLCGDLRFATKGPPERLVLCHCHFCQKSSGGPYAIELFVRKDSFKLLGGTPAIYTHRSAGSGKALHMHFCTRCGTKLYTIFDRYAEVMSVFGGTFDDPEWFETAPKRHVFLESARAGTVIAPGIDVYPQGSFAADGTENAPQMFADFHAIRRSPG
jgi:hypothetical protein